MASYGLRVVVVSMSGEVLYEGELLRGIHTLGIYVYTEIGRCTSFKPDVILGYDYYIPYRGSCKYRLMYKNNIIGCNAAETLHDFIWDTRDDISNGIVLTEVILDEE